MQAGKRQHPPRWAGRFISQYNFYSALLFGKSPFFTPLFQ